MLRGIKTIGVAAVTVVMAISNPLMGGVMAEAETVEQPAYEVIETVGPIEIRQYGSRLAAETDMGTGSGIEDGQYEAFMRLADFIFAKNRQGPEVAMTAPVAVESATEPIAMTAPVEMTGEEGRVMRFFMPAEYTAETLPVPGDDRVRIVTVPAQTLAVLRFSGDATDDEVTKRKAELLAGLQGSDWQAVGEPGYFGYDPPMTPPEQRRNEVVVEVEAVSSATTASG